MFASVKCLITLLVYCQRHVLPGFRYSRTPNFQLKSMFVQNVGKINTIWAPRPALPSCQVPSTAGALPAARDPPGCRAPGPASTFPLAFLPDFRQLLYRERPFSPSPLSLCNSGSPVLVHRSLGMVNSRHTPLLTIVLRQRWEAPKPGPPRPGKQRGPLLLGHQS